MAGGVYDLTDSVGDGLTVLVVVAAEEVGANQLHEFAHLELTH